MRHQDTLGLENANRVERVEVEVISQKVGKSFIYFKGEKRGQEMQSGLSILYLGYLAHT